MGLLARSYTVPPIVEKFVERTKAVRESTPAVRESTPGYKPYRTAETAVAFCQVETGLFRVQQVTRDWCQG